MGQEENPNRGPQLADGSSFAFTYRVFRYPVFVTHCQVGSYLESGCCWRCDLMSTLERHIFGGLKKGQFLGSPKGKSVRKRGKAG